MSLYNNCSHQKWHLVITQYIEDYNECHSGGLSQDPNGSHACYQKEHSLVWDPGSSGYAAL